MAVTIDPQQLASLPPATQKKVEEALDTINDPPLLPGGASDYQEAWTTLLNIVPPLVPRTFGPRHPENRLLQGRSSTFVEGANLCFSSADFDYSREATDFLHANLYSRKGSQYVPLMAASLRIGECSPDQVIAILQDLVHINTPNTRVLLMEIGENHWHDSPEFARAYLELSNITAFPKRPNEGSKPYINTEEQIAFTDRLRAAMLLLIPDSGEAPSTDDEILLENALHQSLQNLFKKERDAFFSLLVNDPKVKAQPVLEQKLRQWGDIDLRRSL